MANINTHSSTNGNLINKVKVNYLSRDFYNVRNDLINYLKAFFPEQWQDFNLASPGMAMVEINAYVADLLSYVIDKKYNELFLDGVQQRAAVYRMAKTFGYSVPGVRASSTIADISLELPATADGPDYTYAPILRPGLRVKGGGQSFETQYQIDFTNDYSENGKANRIIEPILNANQDLIKYKILKREIVKAGITRNYKVEIETGDEKAFYSVILPETNVLEIMGVEVENGVGLTKFPDFSDYEDLSKKFWEVDYLPTSKVFVENDDVDDVNGIKTGKYLDITKRFTKEFLSDGRCKLTFGGGIENFDAFDDYLSELTNTNGCYQTTSLNTSSLLLNPSALGEMVQGNSTIYIKYRIGGGALSNIGSYTLQEVSNVDAVSLGANPAISQAVISSLSANNTIPAFGGRGLPTVAEIKNYIAANFASQKRCVTLPDYISRAYQLPGKFGAPFRIQGMVQDNKIILYVLTMDRNGKLSDLSTNIMKNNLVRYMTEFRMVNDFVEINDGKIINLEIQVDLFLDKSFNSSEIKVAAINKIKNFMDINNWEMNQNIYISQIVDELRETPGVINVVDVRFYNRERGLYSNTLSAQAIGPRTGDPNTGSYTTQIEYIDNAIIGTPLSMFEIKYPEKDIKIRISTGS